MDFQVELVGLTAFGWEEEIYSIAPSDFDEFLSALSDRYKPAQANVFSFSLFEGSFNADCGYNDFFK